MRDALAAWTELDLTSQLVIGGSVAAILITIIGVVFLKERLNLTVLMAEQNFNQAIRIADRGYIIVHGEIVVAADSVDELRGNDIVKRLYLGGVA